MSASHWYAIAAAAFAFGIYLLWIFIWRLVRLPASVVEHDLSVIAHQNIEFSDIGEKYLHVEGPRFTTAFSRISFGLVDSGTGMPVRLKRVILRAVMGGVSRAKLLLRTFAIDHAGCYTLQIGGIKEGVDYARMRIVITKPYLARLVMYILGIIAGSWLTIGGAVLIILHLTHAL